METFNNFIERINSFQPLSFKECAHDFVLNASARDKVNVDGGFTPFYGVTVMFDLHETIKRELTTFQNRIHEIAGDYLAVKLNPDKFHMTLHDLCIFENNDSVAPPYEMEVKQITTDIFHSEFSICMKSTWIFSMVNRSIVLGLSPESEFAFNRLISLYELFEKCVPLPYSFTPHITLAYYKSDSIPYDVMMSLAAFAEEASLQNLCVPLKGEQLGYYRFSNMNEYDRIHP
jgi:2'-5' RNA ligase